MADEIIVRIRAEGQDQFIRDLKKAGVAVDDVGDKTEKTSKKMKSSFSSLGKVIGGAFATAAVIQFGKALGKLAVDLDATDKKFKTVFGSASKIVEDFAKTNATSLGLTESQYKKAAAAAGDLLIPLGFTRKVAAEQASALVNLSGALAAWTGGQKTATEVSDILTKALLGEREQLKTLGINILEADVKTRLLEKGQAKLTGTALAQAKALATLELITEKSADAQAAFADDTTTLAEAQLQLQAKFANIAEEIATELIPVYEELLSALNDIDWAKIGDNVGRFAKVVFSELSDVGKQFRILARDINAINESFKSNDQKRLEAKKRISKELQELDVESLDSYIKVLEAEIESIEEVTAKNKKARKEQEKDVALREQLIRLANKFAGIKEQEALAREKAIKLAAGESEEVVVAVRSLQFLNDELKKQQKIIKESEPFSPEFNAAAAAANALKIEIKGINDALKDMFKAGLTTFQNIPADVETVGAKLLGDPEDLKKQGLAITKTTDQLRDEDLEKEKQLADQKLALREANAQGAIDIASTTSQLFGTLAGDNAKAQKANAAFEIGLNTSIAITKALTRGPIIGPILAAVIAGLATAQLSQVLSTPIPQFAKGTKGSKTAPEGFAWVGEDGPELMQMKGGEKIITNADSEKMMKLLGGYGIPVQFKTTYEELYKPMSAMRALAEGTPVEGIDWNPLLNSNDRGRRSSGKKLDRIYEEMVRLNRGLSRKMTRA